MVPIGFVGDGGWSRTRSPQEGDSYMEWQLVLCFARAVDGLTSAGVLISQREYWSQHWDSLQGSKRKA